MFLENARKAVGEKEEKGREKKNGGKTNSAEIYRKKPVDPIFIFGANASLMDCSGGSCQCSSLLDINLTNNVGSGGWSNLIHALLSTTLG